MSSIAKLVPKLRFPEFRDTGSWSSVKLKLLSNRVTARNKNGKEKRVLTNSAEYGVVDQRDYFEKDIADKGNLENYFIVDRGDFVYNPRISASAPVGPISRNNVGLGVMSPLYTVFRFKEPESDFFAHYFKTAHWHTYLRCVSNTGARHDRMSVSADDFESMPIPSPKPAEQKKIADCLSSVDELIVAQARKLDALKTHKKGLMQNLFPREGETQPRLRFPEFRKAGAWAEKELGQLITIKGRIGYRGYTVADIVNAGEGAISLSPSNITESGVLGFDKATYITWAKYHESPEIMVKREQTLLVKTGSTFGKAAYVWDLPQECTVNPQIVVLKPHSIHPYFLFLLVSGEVIQTKIRAIVVGGAIPTLSQEAVSKFKIRVPAPGEQQRIASCLTTLDALITAEAQKLEELKTHKRGLMQQLFPSPEEE